MTGGCSHEPAIVEAIIAGRWPAAVDEETRMHVDQSDSCREVAIIAPVLRDEYLALRHDTQLPSAAQVWWRAAVRARLEAAQDASRPITLAQGVAGAAAAGLLVAIVTASWPLVSRVGLWLLAAVLHVDPGVTDAGGFVLSTVARGLFLIVPLAVALIIAPVALYFALSDE
jgi:hypothetical protein